jgi:hypothetical protein
MPGRGLADSEGLAARFAAVALGTRRGKPKTLVASDFRAYRHPMVGAGRVGAGRIWPRFEITQEASALFDNASVALEWRVLAADSASHRRNIYASGCNDIAILRAGVQRSTAGYGGQRRDAIVGTRRILAEIDLNTVNVGRHPPDTGAAEKFTPEMTISLLREQ